MPEAQVFYLFLVVVLTLPFPFWDKGAFGGEIVVVKVPDVGNQVALAVPDVKASLVIKFLAADNSGNFKIGLFVPSYALALIQPFTVLLFVQNAKELVPKGKAQIGIAVIELFIIKGGMLGEADGERDAVGLFLGGCFRFLFLGVFLSLGGRPCFLLLGDDRFQMVVHGVLTELFLKFGTAHFRAKQRELWIPQGYGILA